MSQIINIDKFRDTVTVELERCTYTVDTITVEEFINNTVVGTLEKARQQGVKEYCRAAIDLLKKRSDIPEVSLYNLTPKQMEAILIAIQGVDPNIILGQDEDKKK